jgi:hypothetical protein
MIRAGICKGIIENALNDKTVIILCHQSGKYGRKYINNRKQNEFFHSGLLMLQSYQR